MPRIFCIESVSIVYVCTPTDIVLMIPRALNQKRPCYNRGLKNNFLFLNILITCWNPVWHSRRSAGRQRSYDGFDGRRICERKFRDDGTGDGWPPAKTRQTLWQTKNAPDNCYRNEITVGDNGRTNLCALRVGVIKCRLRLGSTRRTQLHGRLYLPSTNGIYCYRSHRLIGERGDLPSRLYKHDNRSLYFFYQIGFFSNAQPTHCVVIVVFFSERCHIHWVS